MLSHKQIPSTIIGYVQRLGDIEVQRKPVPSDEEWSDVIFPEKLKPSGIFTSTVIVIDQDNEEDIFYDCVNDWGDASSKSPSKGSLKSFPGLNQKSPPKGNQPANIRGYVIRLGNQNKPVEKWDEDWDEDIGMSPLKLVQPKTKGLTPSSRTDSKRDISVLQRKSNSSLTKNITHSNEFPRSPLVSKVPSSPSTNTISFPISNPPSSNSSPFNFSPQILSNTLKKGSITSTPSPKISHMFVESDEDPEEGLEIPFTQQKIDLQNKHTLIQPNFSGDWSTVVKEKSSVVSKNQTQAHIFPTPPSSCSSPQNGSDIDGDDDWSEIIIPENYLCQENLISNNQRRASQFQQETSDQHLKIAKDQEGKVRRILNSQELKSPPPTTQNETILGEKVLISTEFYGDGTELDTFEDFNPKAKQAEARVKKNKIRRKPTLIKNLGSPSFTKNVGEMSFNPINQSWDGNWESLSEFDTNSFFKKHQSSSDKKANNSKMYFDKKSRKWIGNEEDGELFGDTKVFEEVIDEKIRNQPFQLDGEFITKMRKIEDEHHKFASVWLDKHGNFPIAEKDFDHLFLIRAIAKRRDKM